MILQIYNPSSYNHHRQYGGGYKKEMEMNKTIIGKAVRIGAAIAVFASGWFCGTLSQRSADAQMNDLGKSVMEKAGDQGGALGAAGEARDVHQ